MITCERLREVLRYDAETGKFVWLQKLSNKCEVDGVAGRLMVSGYRDVGIDGTRYYSHRLAVLYMLGEWPDSQVDHINLDRSDNRWCNLRLSTCSQNHMNTRLQSNNSTGAKGVYLHASGKWAAEIRVGGAKQHLGLYENFETACVVRRTAMLRYHGEFAREG